MDKAESINILADFCGKRDISSLSQKELQNKYGYKQADVFVLFGGSILEGGNVLATAIQEEIAKKYIIVGGNGHTTEALRQKMHGEMNEIETKALSEAEIFAAFLDYKYHLHVDYLEKESTNCGNNITYLMEVLEKNDIPHQSIIIAQDATMQCRMEKVLRKQVSEEMDIINYATYKVHVKEEQGMLTYLENVWGMWDMERYISLLMGEIPRLTDDENGYGPLGKDYIVHVDIPDRVAFAFAELEKTYKDSVRAANPEYASK